MSPGPKEHIDEMVAGIAACRDGQWRKGLTILSEVAQHDDPDNPYPGYFYSYLGVAMARCEGRKSDGVELARYGVELEPRDPETRLNLARAYMMVRDRRRAVKQLKLGLQLSPNHRALLDLQQEIGYRRRPFIPFLPRGFFLNQWLGRMTWRAELRRRQRLEMEREQEELDRLAEQ